MKEMVLTQREDIEWINVWHDCANKDCSRILLIGDSVMRMERSILSNILHLLVDLFATSLQPYDPCYALQLNAFFASKEYQYDKIVVQVTHHGLSSATEIQYRQYEEAIAQLYTYLATTGAKLLAVSLLYHVIHKKRFCNVFAMLLGIKEIYDKKSNRVIDEYNSIVKRVAQEKIFGYMT